MSSMSAVLRFCAASMPRTLVSLLPPAPPAPAPPPPGIFGWAWKGQPWPEPPSPEPPQPTEAMRAQDWELYALRFPSRPYRCRRLYSYLLEAACPRAVAGRGRGRGLISGRGEESWLVGHHVG